MKIIILDTETTGVLEEDRICQLSYLVVDQNGNIEEVLDDLCTPPLPIKFDSMAIHNITPEMIEGKPQCVETAAYHRLNELNTAENLIVIQNAEFDLGMLAKEGFTSNMQLVDTFRIMRAKIPLDTPHGLQHKRYQYGLYKKEQAMIDSLGIEVRAHDALGDVIVLKNLFDHLAGDYSVSEMITLCSAPIVLEYMVFGKNKGKRIEDVALNDRRSIEYMLSTFDLDEDLKHSFEYWMQKTRGEVVTKLGFGKYRGKTPEEIAETDMSYLGWLYNKAENISDELREAIKVAYEKRNSAQ